MLAIRDRCRGFTLLETAISLIIIGVVAAPLLMIYNNYQTEMKKRTTYENVYNSVSSLQEFRNITGRYPCPAPLNVPRTDPTYGREGDCTDDGAPGPGGDTAPMSLAAGNCGSGFCVESSVRGGLTNNRVAVGMLPFRTLQLEESKVADAYKGRLIYAVTESMTDADTIDDSLGAIAVRDADGEPLIDPDGSAGYVVLSHGPNQIGAYNKTGNLIEACAVGPLEAENCNVGFETGVSASANAIYVSSFRSEGAANQYDDTTLYYSRAMEPLWKRTTANQEDIHDLSPQFTGIGVPAPSVQLDISSAAQGNDSLGAYGTTGADGQILTDLICDENGANCFNPNVIGGAQADGEGMDCPNANEYMVGIENGVPRCAPIAVICPDSAPILIGRNADGSARCSTAPACSATAFTLCSANDVNVPTASEGYTTAWIGPRGSCRYRRYRCTATGWQTYSSWGACSFTATEYDATGLTCPSPLSGTYTERRRTLCGGGYEVLSSTAAADCFCDVPETTTEWRVNACPSGYIPDPVSGPPETQWNFNEPLCQWQPTLNTRGGCVCDVPAVTTQWIGNGSCPSGFNPNPTGPEREQEFDPVDCRWEDTGNTRTDCVCDTDPLYEEELHICDNPVCEEPDPTKPDVYRIDIDASSCTPQPRVLDEEGECRARRFKWSNAVSTGTPAPTTPADPNFVDDSCSCAEHVATTTNPQNCYNQDDPNWIIHECRCQ